MAAKQYRVCEYCGAHLDPGERCDCRDDISPQVIRDMYHERHQKEVTRMRPATNRPHDDIDDMPSIPFN